MRKIVTEHVYPPIPIRNFDWSAVFDGYDPGDVVGHGKTEQEAIDDLLKNEAARAAEEDDEDEEDTNPGLSICPSCDGTGEGFGMRLVCRPCRGSGELSDASRAEDDECDWDFMRDLRDDR